MRKYLILIYGKFAKGEVLEMSFKKKEFIMFTLFPVIIPYIVAIFEKILYRETLIFMYITLIVLYVFVAIKFYKKIENGKLKKYSEIISQETFFNARDICERKRDYIISKTYNNFNWENGISEENIPYSVHDYIAEICKSFCDTISKITNIKKTYMSVTFIYRYVYDATSKNGKTHWKWIVGKEGTTTIPLNDFASQSDTLYHYLIDEKENGNSNCVFCNSKRDLEKERHYHMSSRDKAHDYIGSVFGSKLVFGNNATQLAEGILIVSTYGEQFIKKEKQDYNEKELKNLILEELYPYYQRLLETELGMLCLRHDKNKDKKEVKD